MRFKLSTDISIDELESALGQSIDCKSKTIGYITTDSRLVKPGDLFIPLAKSEADAAEHTKEALKNGGYLLAERRDCISCRGKSRELLFKTAALVKKKLPNLKYTVAITGSLGKTTVKDLTAAVISEKFRTHKTELNQNNELGLSYTLLSAPTETEVLVVELGMNHAGEIARMANAISPDVAVITNITSAHIGNLGSKEAIAAAKLEINEGMNEQGITLIPHGEKLLRTAKNSRTVSLSEPKSNFFALPLAERKNESVFDFYSESNVLTNQKIRIPGHHILFDTAFALSVASILRLSSFDIEEALSKISPDILRQRFLTFGKFKIFDDTYSSSPEAVISTYKSLQTSASEPISALIGDMLELGDYTSDAHYTLGKNLAKLGIRKLYAFGNFAKTTAEGALSNGMNENRIFINSDLSNPEKSAKQIFYSYDGEIILFKGSHNTHSERIINLLKNL